MKQYLEAGKHVLIHGNWRGDRTGTGTLGVFGYQTRFNLMDGFPLLTTKKMFVKGIIHELLWFLRGSTNNNDLLAHGVHIWDEWAIDHKVDFPLSYTELYSLLAQKFGDEFLNWYAEKCIDLDRPAGLEREHLAAYAAERGLKNTKRKLIQTGEDRRSWASAFCSKEANAELCRKISEAAKAGTDSLTLEPMVTKWLDEMGVPSIATAQQIEADGDLGPVYGKQWRSWGNKTSYDPNSLSFLTRFAPVKQGDTEILFKDGTPTGMKIVYHACPYDGPHLIVAVKEFDQMAELIEGLKKKPFSRRHIISAWNVADLPDESVSAQENAENGKMALAPCHCLFQFYVEQLSFQERVRIANEREVRVEVDSGTPTEALLTTFFDEIGLPKYKLSCQLYQRSADFCLGVPFNIASYALLTMMVAQCVNMVPGDFIHTFGDLHIYSNHVATFRDFQILREPRPLPKMWINPEVKDIFAFKFEDFKLEGYDPHPAITNYAISV